MSTDVGKRIKDRREELGMTQQELASLVGYKSRSSVNKIECSRDLPLKKVRQFAKALDCEPAELMGWTDDAVALFTSGEADGRRDDLSAKLYGKKMRGYDILHALDQLSADDQRMIIDMILRLEGGDPHA